jgi:hypothetical protein
MPHEYLHENAPVRYVSVSSDARYLSIAGKFGFSHLSTASNRWRILEDPETFIDTSNGDVPHVRGGMVWYNNLLLIGADLGETHEVSSL